MIDPIKSGQDNDINQAFRDGAELVIVKPGHAYIQLGTMRYYFSGAPRLSEVTLFDGSKVTEQILPYDGWEQSVGYLGVEAL